MSDKQLYEWLLNYAQRERPYYEYTEKWERILQILEVHIDWD